MSDARVYGVDVSAPTDGAAWSCLVGRGCGFAVVRGYRDANGGEPDAACPATVAAAWAAGLAFVDVYHFPVPSAKTAVAQADELLGFLAGEGVRYGRIWLDVEGDTTSGTWSPAVTDNIDFIAEYLAAIARAGAAAGIYASTATWTAITGNTRALGHVPLWWCSHGAAWSPVGGWRTPLLVQYAFETAHCGVTYDSDYTDDVAAASAAPVRASVGERFAMDGVVTLRRLP